MIAILKNNMRRLWTQKQLIILLIVFTTIATIAAVFISTGYEKSWDVAVVTDQIVTAEVSNVNFIVVEQTPGLSELVSGRYDGILTINSDGSYQLDSIKSEREVSQLIAVLEGKQSPIVLFSDRGTGTNVLGFLMMFILLMGSMAMYLYTDDKEQHLIDRVVASPVPVQIYLLAHSLFNFCFLYFPTMIILLIVQSISGIQFNYSWLELAGLLAILCGLSTVFSLLLYSVLPNKNDSAKMTGNTIIILTSILAGGFYAFDQSNRVLAVVLMVLPQKAYLILADGIEQGQNAGSYLLALAYLLVLIVGCYGVSVYKTKRQYINMY